MGNFHCPFLVKKYTESPVTGDSTGAPCSSKSGISSRSARGSRTAPERQCAPISRGFFNDVNIFRLELPARLGIFVVRFEKLSQPQAATEPGWTRAHDQHIGFESLTLDFRHELNSLKKIGKIRSALCRTAVWTPFLA